MFLNLEWRAINEYLGYLFSKKPNLSIPYDRENKLITNELAKNIGFNIPPSIISTVNRSIRETFSDKGEQYFLAKRVSNFLSGETNYREYYQHEGAIIETNTLESYESKLLPCVTQSIIDYKYELRLLYIDGDIFSVIKYAKCYLPEMPYKLDEDIHMKVCILMKQLNLIFGSIDLLIDTSNNCYFLEVNPHGQFDVLFALGDFNVYQNIFDFLYENEKLDVQ